MIRHNPGGSITYSYPNNLREIWEQIVTHAAEAYGFLLNTPERRGREFTWPEFAEIIERHCANSPRLQAITHALRKLE